MPVNVGSRRLLLALPFMHFGVGRLALDLAAAAVVEGWAVDALTCGTHDDRGLVEEVRAMGGTVHRADISSREPDTMREAAARVGTICDVHDITAIHAFTAPAAAAGLGHRPVIASAVGWSPHKPLGQRLADAAVLNRCAVVTAVSDAVRTELREAGLARPDLRLILHGVALEPSRNLAIADPAAPLRRIGIMAHLIERKGVDVLLRAVAELDPRTWDQLIIAGHGEAEPQLRAMAHALFLEGRVTWLGHAATSQFFRRVDVVVVPSRSDALPLLLLQAMAYGRPVVASAVGGIPEGASHPDEALLVEPGNHVALAAALRRTLADPPAALRRACAARRRVERDFSLQKTMEQYVHAYRMLAGSAQIPQVPVVVSPAMEAGVATHVWSIEEIVGLLD